MVAKQKKKNPFLCSKGTISIVLLCCYVILHFSIFGGLQETVMLCPVSGSPVNVRYALTGAILGTGCQVWWGNWSISHRGEAERAGTLQPGEEEAQEWSHLCVQVSDRSELRREIKFFKLQIYILKIAAVGCHILAFFPMSFCCSSARSLVIFSAITLFSAFFVILSFPCLLLKLLKELWNPMVLYAPN